MRTDLWPKGGGTRPEYAARPAAAATRGRNAAPPRSRASKTTFSLGTDVNEDWAPPSETEGDRGPREGTQGHAPRRCSAADWTRKSSHSGFEAGGGKGEEPEHAPRPSVVADWPTESPRSILEGSLWSSHQGSAEDWLF